MSLGVITHDIVVHAGGVSRTPADVFDQIYVVFLALGTLVGAVVIGYTLYNAVAYRDRDDRESDDGKVTRPTLGELPEGSGGGRKLFVSFGISAVIVISLILWTYSALLYVDSGPEPDVDGGNAAAAIDGVNEDGVLVIDVIGQRFSWIFVYPNGHQSTTLTVPRNVSVKLNVTSGDVMHNIGIPAFNAKTDAIPGQTTTTWFVPHKTGTFQAACYELCGSGHSIMTSDVVVMEQSEYQDWYDGTKESQDGENGTAEPQDGNSTESTAQQSVSLGAVSAAGLIPLAPTAHRGGETT